MVIEILSERIGVAQTGTYASLDGFGGLVVSMLASGT